MREPRHFAGRHTSRATMHQWETDARAGTQGAEFNIVVTFLVKPLKLGKP